MMIGRNPGKIMLVTFLLFAGGEMKAQTQEQKATMDIYGFIMMDMGYNVNQIDPNWFDVMRPTKLPSSKNEFGTDGNSYFSVRQSRLGFKGYADTPLGQLKTLFEIDMFGVGADAGQTTIRLRHAYAELGKFGAGQTHSPFMDIDVFPNTIDYWGPNGMVFFRNVQIRYMPIQGATRLTFALERPGASADAGIYADRIELTNVKSRFPLPDFSAEYHQATKFGYVELAGMLRRIEWVDQGNNNLSGKALGWGLNLSTNIHMSSRDIFRGQCVYGEGIQNYFNDAPVDIGIQNDPGSLAGVKGVALPILGIVTYLDHTWSEKFTSAFGYSTVHITNSDAQSPNSFRQGNYISANLAYYPAKNAMACVEYQYFDRENHTDGWRTSATKIQVSLKYNFSQSL